MFLDQNCKKFPLKKHILTFFSSIFFNIIGIFSLIKCDSDFKLLPDLFQSIKSTIELMNL